MNLSQLEARTCYRCQLRENAFKRVPNSVQFWFCAWVDEMKACLLWLGSQNRAKNQSKLDAKKRRQKRIQIESQVDLNLFIDWNKGTLAVIKTFYKVQQTLIFIINRCYFVTFVSDEFCWFLVTERSKITLNECEKSCLIRNNSKLTMKMTE